MSIIGEPFAPYVDKQIKVRQELMGKLSDRGPEMIAWANSKTAWVKLASGVFLSGSAAVDRLEQIGLSPIDNYLGTQLAEQYILFGGTSTHISGSNQLTQRSTFDQVYDTSDTDFGLVPMPGIESIDVKDRERGSIKEAIIQIKAYSRRQLEIIDALYLKLGYTVLLEWGNSHYISNPNEEGVSTYKKMNVTHISEATSFFHEPEKPQSKYSHLDYLTQVEARRAAYDGNYDGFLAKVTNFSWNFEPDGTYKITLKLISLGAVIESLKINISPSETNPYPKGKEIPPKDVITEYLDNWILINFSDQNKSPSTNSLISIEKTDNQKYGYFVNANSKEIPLSIDYDDSFLYKDTFETERESLRNNPNFQAVLKNSPNSITFKEGGIGLLGRYPPLNSTPQKLNTPLDDLPDDENVTKLYGFGTIKLYLTLNFNVKIKNPITPQDQTDVFYMAYNVEEGENINVNDKNNLGSYYLRFGELLNIIERYCIPINKNGNLKQIRMKVNTIPSLVYPNQISLDPRICLVRNTLLKPNSTPIEIFSELQPFFDPTSNSFIGEATNIYLNFSSIVNSLDSNLDEEGNLSLFNFLSDICSKLNKALGGINNFEPIIEEEKNQLIIIDSSLNSPNINQSQTPLQVYGYNGKIGSESESTFVRNVTLKTEISPEYASMVTIGATAGGYTKGIEATAFSKWNKGIIDRFQEEYEPPNTIKNERPDPNLPLIQYGNFLSNINNPLQPYGYDKEYENTTGKLIFSFSTIKPITLNPTLIDTNLSIATEYYKFLTAKTYQRAEREDPNSFTSNLNGFIPFNLQLTMDGISGIKIYNKVEVDTRFLPYNYPDSLKYIIKRVSHKLSNGDWETTIDTTSTPIVNFKNGDRKAAYDKLNVELFDEINSLQTISPNAAAQFAQIQLSNVSNEDTSGYYPGRLWNTCGTKTIYTANISAFNSLKGFKNSPLSRTLIDSIRPIVTNSKDGLCARAVTNAAYLLINSYKANSSTIVFDNIRPQSNSNDIAGGTVTGLANCDANDKDMHDTFLSNKLGYRKYIIAENLPRTEVLSTINKLKVEDGDIIIYWANDSQGGDTDKLKYGHIQMYYFKDITGINATKKYFSDFQHSPFVYPSGECWTILAFKSPNI